jgi:mannose-6-phosphate isomerase-like protein (cupin superfamily)
VLLHLKPSSRLFFIAPARRTYTGRWPRGAVDAGDYQMDYPTDGKRRDIETHPIGAPIVDAFALQSSVVEADHNGRGPIQFRRAYDRRDLRGIADFVDATLVPPGSSIGVHRHERSLEIYFVVRGSPLVTIDGRPHRLGPGGLCLVHPGGSHGLVNDTTADVAILVVQVPE